MTSESLLNTSGKGNPARCHTNEIAKGSRAMGLDHATAMQ